MMKAAPLHTSQRFVIAGAVSGWVLTVPVRVFAAGAGAGVSFTIPLTQSLSGHFTMPVPSHGAQASSPNPAHDAHVAAVVFDNRFV